MTNRRTRAPAATFQNLKRRDQAVAALIPSLSVMHRAIGVPGKRDRIVGILSLIRDQSRAVASP